MARAPSTMLRYATHGPPPPLSRGRMQTIPFSRCGSHPSCCSRTNFFALRTDLRQRTPAVDAGILTICASSHECKKRKQGSGTPTDADLPTAPKRGAARAERCALASRRPTTALAKGTLVPKAQLQARLPGTWFHQALPGVSCPSPVAAPHAPVVMPASMMPEAAREWR
jgi:hypothetical protein